MALHQRKGMIRQKDAGAYADYQNQTHQRVHLEKGDVDPGEVAGAAQDVFENQGKENQYHRYPIWQTEPGKPAEAQKYKPGEEMQGAR